MANIKIRGVPDEVHDRLKSHAALAGQSLNAFLVARLSELASFPTIPELAERIREHEPYTGPSSTSTRRGNGHTE